MCTRYDYCMEDGRVCGVTEKLIEQWFDEKLEVLNETLDVCRQQSAFGNVFLESETMCGADRTWTVQVKRAVLVVDGKREDLLKAKKVHIDDFQPMRIVAK